MPPLSNASARSIQTFLNDRDLASPLELDLFKVSDSEVAAGGVDLAELKQMRRQHNLAAVAGPDLAAALDAQGITSAFQISNMAPGRFVAEFADKLGVSGAEARTLHDHARRIASRTMHMFASVRGAVASPHARAMASSTTGLDQIAYFESLPSYQDLFGSLNFCACEECKSIFGAAAYFVDLMRIIDAYITKPNSATIPTAFLLQSRRPDLWNIPLTCAATNDVMPALDIVNQVLTSALVTGLNQPSADALMEAMATTYVYPSNLPFNYPLDRVRILCEQVDQTLAKVYAVWHAAPAAVVDESLGLSPERAAIVSTPTTDPAKLAAFYNVPQSDLEALKQVDRFMQSTGLTVPQIQRLIVQGLTTDEIAANVPENLFINQGLGADFLTLTETGGTRTSTIDNLNDTALDQINRLRRLADAVAWSTPAVDWFLRAVKNGGTPAIDADGLAGIDRINRLATLFSQPPVQIATLFGPIKTYGGDTLEPGTPSPFDALFNGPVTVAQSGLYQPSGNPLNSLYTDTPLPWTPGSSADADVAAITRVALGLDQSLTSLNQLGVTLYGNTQVHLTVETLSALFRHGLLSRCFNLPMDQYVLLLALNGAADKAVFEGPDVDGLIAAWQWMTAAGLNVYTLAYVMQGLPSPYVDPLYAPDNVTPWLASLRNVVPDASAPGAEDAIEQQLAVFFNTDPTIADPCLTMALAAVPLPEGATTWAEAFLAVDNDGQPAYPDYVQAVINRQSRWLVLARAGQLSAELLASVSTYPAAYGLPADFATITWAMVAAIVGLANLQRRFGDVRNNLIAYIALAETNATRDAQIAALSAGTGWEPAQIAQLLDGIASGVANLVAQIMTMDTCFKQIAAFGADTAFLTKLADLSTKTASDGWTTYTQMADLCQSKVSARLGQKRWAQVALDVEGQLQVHKRDALVGLELTLLNASYPDITTPNDVYEFLLTDVEIGPEAQLSYIKEGLNALQLYLQRCRLRLEPGVEVIEIPPVWWEWMMNYRVWEANRRIYVYPENYLQPSLRTNETTLFQQLEADLQQSEITPAYVEKAYATYLTSFSEVAKLEPVDSVRCTIDDPQRGKIKALYLFARTETSPYTYYFCRQIDGTPWSEWKKIELSINSPYLTPVYAFSRLFLFWVEVTAVSSPSIEVGTTGGQTNNDLVFQATLKYSFQDHQGEWVQPQTLVGDLVILFKRPGSNAVPLATDTLFANDWNIDSVPWRRLTAQRLAAANWPAGTAPSNSFERIMIGFGPYVSDVGTQNLTPNTTTPDSVAAQVFVNTLVDRVWDNNRIVLGRLSGGLTVMANWVLNENLDTSYLTHKGEFLLVDGYRHSAPLSQYRANLDDLSGTVQIVNTAAPITADNFGDMVEAINLSPSATAVVSTDFASETITTAAAQSIFSALVAAEVLSKSGTIDPSKMPALDLNVALDSLLADGTVSENQLPAILGVLLANLGSPLLFSTVEGTDSHITSVKNQPGWFQLTAGPERFLLQPASDVDTNPHYSTVSEGTLQSAPLVNANSLVLPMLSTPITLTQAQQAFSTLRLYGIIDDRGVVNYAALKAAPLSVVLANMNLSPAQLAALNGVVYNMPIVYPDDFVTERINAETSEAIYALLSAYRIIDEAHRLHLEMLTSQLLAQILANLISIGTLLPRDVSTVYRILVESPQPVTLTYWNSEDTSGFISLAGITFQVMRLTTAATATLNRAFFVGGIDQLLSLRTQEIPVVPVLPFGRLTPSDQIVWPSAIDGAQVDFDGLYGQYFWELYYFGPLLVANSLAANQKFSDALSWFQYVFDPTVKEVFVQPDTFATESNQAITPTASQEAYTLLQQNDVDDRPILSEQGRVNPEFTASTSLSFLPSTFTPVQVEMIRNVLLNYQLAAPASHFWMFRPFRMQTLESLSYMLSDDNPAILAYENDPFDPFAVARLRVGAFEKATVMQYIDTLIDWGDSYFAQGTWESITAATMLYVYASNLLGPRPQEVGECEDEAPATFADIVEAYGDNPIPIFLIDLESTLPPVAPDNGEPVPIETHAFNDLGAYFCVPENDVLMSYWDRVEAQLYKIRHSLDINGNFRQLALFEPPLDPMALIKAAAGSNNFLPSGAGAQLPTPPNRFLVVLSRARQLAATAMQFGAQLQAALERKDGEDLELLRNTFEDQILNLTTQVLESQISRQENTITALTANQGGAKAALDHYTALIEKDLLPSEQTNLDAMAAALVFNIAGNILQTASVIAYTIPQVGSPFAMTYGGVQLGSSMAAGAAAATIGSDISTFIAQRSLTMAGYQRRMQDWTLAQSNAQHEYDALTSQIAAAGDDLAAARQQLVVHNRQIQQNQEMAKYLTTKFTSQALYQWLAGRLSGLYYQTYRLAMEAAVSAQAAYRYETQETRTFIDFDYWDASHAGLLAGEGLTLALDLMEASYETLDTRRLEIERMVSLVSLNPVALDTLQQTGTCSFSLPELLFDYDYPGQYCRTIKSVSISIPAIVGPYQNIKAILTQTNSYIAVTPSLSNVQWLVTHDGEQPTTVWSDANASNRQIALSRSIDDTGLFVLNFDDPRYLPFEGTGAVSDWTLELPKETNQIDFDKLSDVIVTVRYTAMASGQLKTEIKPFLAQHPLVAGYYVDIAQSFATAWRAFLQDHSGTDTQPLTFPYSPAWMGSIKSMTLASAALRFTVAADVTWGTGSFVIGTLAAGSQTPVDITVDETGLGSLDAPPWTREDMSGDWTIAFDLAAIRTNMPTLLKDGAWIDPAKLLDVEMMLTCEIVVF